jgi:hypothetical protein
MHRPRSNRQVKAQLLSPLHPHFIECYANGCTICAVSLEICHAHTANQFGALWNDGLIRQDQRSHSARFHGVSYLCLIRANRARQLNLQCFASSRRSSISRRRDAALTVCSHRSEKSSEEHSGGGNACHRHRHLRETMGVAPSIRIGKEKSSHLAFASFGNFFPVSRAVTLAPPWLFASAPRPGLNSLSRAIPGSDSCWL